MLEKKLGVLKEFKEFILKHGVVGLAVAVVIGGAVGKVVKALVDNIIMPLVGFLTPSGDWRAIVFKVGSVEFGIGNLLGSLVDFVIVAFVIFMIVKTLLKEPAKSAEPSTKQCPECLESVAIQARKCKFCASSLT